MEKVTTESCRADQRETLGPEHFTLGSPNELVDAFSVTSFLL